MKKQIIIALAAAVAFAPFSDYGTVKGRAEELADAKAAYLCDFESGTPAYQKNETERLPIASMCKIMTLLLCFEAADEGQLRYDEPVTVSENASGMGGSQVFLDTGLTYSASELLKSVVVCSANDSCVALAERLSGSEGMFVERMNERARELGAENTLFANCTGLPKEPQYSCAKDVSIMLRELLRHEKYFEFAKIRLEDFSHPDGRTTSMTNTNKLLRSYNGCDGGKTGFTNRAGFCLAATAKRGNMRVISVVIGAKDSKSRFAGVSNLFDYAFSAFESRNIVEAGKPIGVKLPVRGSRQREIDVCPERTLSIFCKKGEAEDAAPEFILDSDVKAPLEKGAAVGEAIIYRGGVETDRCKLVASESADRFSWGEAYKKIAEKMI